MAAPLRDVQAAMYSYDPEAEAAQAAVKAGDIGLMETRIAADTRDAVAGADLSGYAGFVDPAPAVGRGLQQLYQRNVPSRRLLTRQGPMEGMAPEKVEVSIYLDGALVGKAVTHYVSQNITAGGRNIKWREGFILEGFLQGILAFTLLPLTVRCCRQNGKTKSRLREGTDCMTRGETPTTCGRLP